MALGTNYCRNGYGRHGKNVKNNLAEHEKLCVLFRSAGMDLDAASKLAFSEITNHNKKRGSK